MAPVATAFPVELPRSAGRRVHGGAEIEPTGSKTGSARPGSAEIRTRRSGQLNTSSSIEISAKPTMPASASREAEAGMAYPDFDSTLKEIGRSTVSTVTEPHR